MHVLVWTCSFKRICNHAIECDDISGNVDIVVHGIKKCFEVLRVLIWVNNNHALEEHHLASAEQTESCFPTLPWIALFGRHDSKVVESGFQGQVYADNVSMLET